MFKTQRAVFYKFKNQNRRFFVDGTLTGTYNLWTFQIIEYNFLKTISSIGPRISPPQVMALTLLRGLWWFLIGLSLFAMIISRLPRFYSYYKSVSLETTYFEGKTDTCQLCKKDKRTGKDFFFSQFVEQNARDTKMCKGTVKTSSSRFSCSLSSKTRETRKCVNAL